MRIQWKRYDRRLPIELDVDCEPQYLYKLIVRLVGGSVEGIAIPPRGRMVLVRMEDGHIMLPGAPNAEATAMIGLQVCGDCVILDKDSWEQARA